MQSHNGILSSMDISKVMELEARKLSILKLEEKTWRQKSRAMWLEKGDLNTIFFYYYVDNRRVKYSIWELYGLNGQLIIGHGVLKSKEESNFKNIFQDPWNLSIVTQLRIIQNYPSFFTIEEGLGVVEQVTLNGIKQMMASLDKDKNPCPNGWKVEFFMDFFYLFGWELLEVVEKYRLQRIIVGALDTTFIALIPKSDKPSSFNDFHPIYLCNVV